MIDESFVLDSHGPDLMVQSNGAGFVSPLILEIYHGVFSVDGAGSDRHLDRRFGFVTVYEFCFSANRRRFQTLLAFPEGRR